MITHKPCYLILYANSLLPEITSHSLQHKLVLLCPSTLLAFSLCQYRFICELSLTEALFSITDTAPVPCNYLSSLLTCNFDSFHRRSYYAISVLDQFARAIKISTIKLCCLFPTISISIVAFRHFCLLHDCGLR